MPANLATWLEIQEPAERPDAIGLVLKQAGLAPQTGALVVKIEKP